MAKFKLVWVILIFCCSPLKIAADENDAKKQILGKQLYQSGTDKSRSEAFVTLELTGETISAAAFPCVNCHGQQGEGKLEGSLKIPAINAYALAVSGYDNPKLLTLITKGLGKNNKPINNLMPRYHFTDEQSSALLAYLGQLGSTEDPAMGITSTEIKLASLLPLTGAMSAVGNLLKDTLQACIAEINRQPPFYGRKLSLSVLDSESNLQANDILQRIFKEVKPFALVSGFLPEHNKVFIYQALVDESMPVIAPLTFEPIVPSEKPASFFYFLPSYSDQARALIDFWVVQKAQKSPTIMPEIMVIHSGNREELKIVDVISKQLQLHHIKAVAVVDLKGKNTEILTDNIKKTKADAIFFLGNSNVLKQIAEKGLEGHKQPEILALSAMFGTDINYFSGITGTKLYLATPFSGNDATVFNMVKILSRQGIPLRSPALQLTACSAIDFVVEGLKQAGKRVTRSKFIQSLDEIKYFKVPSMPTLKFDRDSRIGVAGAFVLTVDAQTGHIDSVSEWITPQGL